MTQNVGKATCWQKFIFEQMFPIETRWPSGDPRIQLVCMTGVAINGTIILGLEED